MPQEEGDDDTSGSEWEGIGSEGDLSSLSDGNSSHEADDERYKDLEELYGKSSVQGHKDCLGA